MPHSDNVYLKLEHILKRSKNPLTCTDLYDKPEIRAEAKSSDAVSDHLGYMWRRGLVTRIPAPRTGTKSARYAYSWRKEADAPTKPVSVDDVKTKKVRGFDVKKEPDGSVTLATEELVINIRRK